MNISLSPFAPENLVSRDGIGRLVPRQPAHPHIQPEYGTYAQGSFRFPRRRPYIELSLLWLLVHTFSVLSLQLKKLRRHNKSVIDLSNVNPARGHKEVRRSTGHIMVTARYSNQQGSKSRQNPCQVQPTENIRNFSASRRCLWVRTTVSTVWSAASIIVSESELQATEKTV